MYQRMLGQLGSDSLHIISLSVIVISKKVKLPKLMSSAAISFPGLQNDNSLGDPCKESQLRSH